MVVKSEVRKVDSSSSTFLSKIALAILGLFPHINCKIISPSSLKKCHWLFDRDELDLQIALGSIVIFTTLISFNSKTWHIFLFFSSLISCIIQPVFLQRHVFSCLGRFIPSYAILLVAVGNGSVSLVSLSDFSCCAIGMQRISVYSFCILYFTKFTD